MVSPRYRAEWLRDSSRAGGTLVELERAMRLLRTEGAPTLAQDTTYPLPTGATVKVREQCEVLLTNERCPWQLVVTPGPGARAIEIVIEASAEAHRITRSTGGAGSPCLPRS